ncbi:hypothetical protein CDO52_22290 [Nocardiopsis gilva YIM 90087]|uniref:Uncharacterized protein n=1 Tax=Nocardiopsis gilva YIM 90087 TaxID=1235441 RepID=A0A223SAQ4_9ACTN|nr:hypothetical protein [Nocardiopsis gilva]ASU85156.1 hypothetical protein CDO52_22290 [Nocardiopsis gilva YIM 90087]
MEDPVTTGETDNTDNSAGDVSGHLIQVGSLTGGMYAHYHFHEQPRAERETYEDKQWISRAIRVHAERVHNVCSTFVPPDSDEYERGFLPDFLDVRIGVVTGEPGTGRTTAAIHALAFSGKEIREVSPEDADWDPRRLVAEPGYAYLLDLTSLGEAITRYRPRVRDFATRVAESESWLALVATARQWQADPIDGFARLDLRTPPDPEPVFARHLAHLRSNDEAQRWLRHDEVRALLKGRSPAEAARLAADADRFRHGAPVLLDEEFKQWVTTTLGAFGNWSQELRAWFGRREGSGEFDIALLQAVALLEGCPSDVVLEQTHRLARLWEVESPFPTVVSGAALWKLLEDVGAELADDKTVHLPKQGYGAAVLDFLWHEYPRSRDAVLRWSRTAALALPWWQRADVAHRWYALAARNGDVRPLTRLFLDWAESLPLQPAIVDITARAAVHPELARPVRRFVYDLANTPSARRSVATDAALVRVCGYYGRVEPRSALTRLKWIADRADVDRLRVELHDALTSIAYDAGGRAAVVRELGEWIADGRGRAGIAGAFLAGLLTRSGGGQRPLLFDDLVLTRNNITPEAVGDAWVALFTSGAASTVGEPTDVLRGWLTTVAAYEGDPRPVMRSLVCAGRRSTRANVRITRVVEERRREPVFAVLADRIRLEDPLVAGRKQKGR